MVTKGKWEVKKLPITGGLAIYSGHELIAGGLFEEDASVIVTAVNACTGINPDNPQAVAESISDLYEALKAIEYTMSVDPSELSRDHPITAKMVKEALAKTEGK